MSSSSSIVVFFADHPCLLGLAKGSIILAVTALVFVGMTRVRPSAAERHALLLAGSITALAVPLWSMAPLLDWRMTIVAPRTESPVAARTPGIQSAPSLTPVPTPEVTPTPASAPIPVLQRPMGPAIPMTFVSSRTWYTCFPWASAVLGVWLLGMAATLAPLAMSYARLLGLSLRSDAVTHPIWLLILKEETTRINMRHPVALQIMSPGMGLAPATFGFGRFSRIILPTDALSWAESDIRLVLAHELAHVRRRDWLAQLVGQMLLAVYWFNPLAWWATRRMNREAEFASDDHVINSGVAATTYAECMLKIAERMSRTATLGWTTSSISFSSSLSRRIVMVLDPSNNRRTLGRVSALSLTAGALLAASVTGGAQVARAESAVAPVTSPAPTAPRKETLDANESTRKAPISKKMDTTWTDEKGELTDKSGMIFGDDESTDKSGTIFGDDASTDESGMIFGDDTSTDESGTIFGDDASTDELGMIFGDDESKDELGMIFGDD